MSRAGEWQMELDGPCSYCGGDVGKHTSLQLIDCYRAWKATDV